MKQEKKVYERPIVNVFELNLKLSLLVGSDGAGGEPTPPIGED